MWEAVDGKYSKANTGDEKYVVGEYFEFKMMDDKSVLDQTHEMQNLVAKIIANGFHTDERRQVPTVVYKFPPSWRDFQVSLKLK